MTTEKESEPAFLLCLHYKRLIVKGSLNALYAIGCHFFAVILCELFYLLENRIDNGFFVIPSTPFGFDI